MNGQSRYRFCTIERDAAGRLYHGPRPHFTYRELDDTRIYTVAAGDTLGGIAARFFPSFPRPECLFWIIADFQPEPIRDAFARIPVGTKLFIPSEIVVRTRILVLGRSASDERLGL